MEALASLGWPTALTWGASAFAAAATVIAHTHAFVRQAFHRRRLDRRLARNAYIERDEQREYELAIGGDIEPPQVATVAKAALQAGLLVAVPFWLAQGHLEHWWEYGTTALFVFALLVGLWRRLNDPPPPESDEVDPLNMPLSVAGFVGAVATFLLFGILVITVI